jgi:hypothetical protein
MELTLKLALITGFLETLGELLGEKMGSLESVDVKTLWVSRLLANGPPPSIPGLSPYLTKLPRKRRMTLETTKLCIPSLSLSTINSLTK